MSAASRRGAAAEERAAVALGTRRIHRRRGESAPDLMQVKTSTGATLGPEVKSRKRLPALVTGALDQARRYFGTRAIPIAVLYAKGAHDGIVCLRLADFTRLVGIEAPNPNREAGGDHHGA